MNKIWNYAKRELSKAIHVSGRPDLALAVVSGTIAWAIVGLLRILLAGMLQGFEAQDRFFIIGADTGFIF